MPPHRVFISLRFSEAMEESEALKKALDERGVPTFLCSVAAGDSIADAVIEAIDECELVVIMGTHTYGEKLGSKFSSCKELEFIMDEEKPFFLVKMCDRFKHAKTRFWFPSTIADHPWRPQGAERSQPPDELVDAIIAKLKDVTGVGASVKQQPQQPQQPQQQEAGGPASSTSLDISSPSSSSSSQVHGVRAVSGGGAEDAVRKLQNNGISMHAAEIVQLMQAFPASADVQRFACKALEDQARDNGSKRVEAAASGAIDAIIKAMKMHSSNGDVQEKGCAALWNLAENDDNVVSIASKGGIDVVIAAMKMHSSNSGVQVQGCGALWKLAYNNYRVAIALKGGIDAVVSAMKIHTNNEGVQHKGCGALQNLACYRRDNKRAIALKGGIDAVIAAMKNHIDNSKVQHQGCGALHNLAVNDDDNKVATASKGGIDAVIAAMKSHTNNAGVQQNGFAALCNIACNNDDNKVAIASKGGIDAVVAAMKTHTNDGGVQKNGCGVLAHLALHPDLRGYLRSENVSLLARQAKKSYPGNSQVYEWTTSLLRSLA
ncbi:hypothetical protein PTSG_10776 [Salpingoeca rosetta]|uniref:DUF4062 domain-containing protein n=1 Tax=Salpingoeca rosetta (strain ATCC 50818 / BSB-021) TaxID=946362 RepID=F2UQC3_SALR5|nr:uncharacterized protein PTSG_10776 [Salpingoeca rosetta]EGD79791.1 hypothetical protein PTSG_10776 [Salpingoeca rosetta]|eukprot:XP_004988740.1 hypothetical protein PTSG_10776 [Salpingoeca rosetta]